MIAPWQAPQLQQYPPQRWTPAALPQSDRRLASGEEHTATGQQGAENHRQPTKRADLRFLQTAQACNASATKGNHQGDEERSQQQKLENEPRYFAVQVKPELMTADRPSASVRDQPTKRKMKPIVRARTRGSPIRRTPEVSAVGIAVSMEDIHTASLEIGRVML